MDKQFDELSKSLAEGTSRREALRKLGVGLVGMMLAALGVRQGAAAAPRQCHKASDCLGPGIANASCCKGVCVTSTNPSVLACCDCPGCNPPSFNQDKSSPNYQACISLCSFNCAP